VAASAVTAALMGALGSLATAAHRPPAGIAHRAAPLHLRSGLSDKRAKDAEATKALAFLVDAVESIRRAPRSSDRIPSRLPAAADLPARPLLARSPVPAGGRASLVRPAAVLQCAADWGTTWAAGPALPPWRGCRQATGVEVALLLSSSAVQEAHLVQRWFPLSVRITGGCDGAGRAGALKG
jgi:hypothetical protein